MHHILLRTSHAPQRGFSITELMVSSGLGLGVLTAMLSAHVALSTSTLDSLAASKLEQDISAAMQLMANELRRAGHVGGGVAVTENPFAATLAIFDDMQANRRQPANGSGSCIVHAWDADGDGIIADSELSGFRLTADGAVQMRTAGNLQNPNSCTSQGASWIALTDPELVTVSMLNFNLAHSTCINASEPDGLDDNGDGTVDETGEADCFTLPPARGDLSVEQTDIVLTISAQLASDAFVRLAQTQRVHLRNAVVRQH
jgi:type II secretory pathway component PulJ